MCLPSGLPVVSYSRHITAIVLGPSISHRLLCCDMCMGVLMEDEAIKEGVKNGHIQMALVCKFQG